jgi:hypothetical protein
MSTLHRLILFAALAALCGAGCDSAQPAPPPAGGGVFEEFEAQAKALEARLGPDAYTQAEMEVIIKALEALPASSDDHERAQRLARELGAKRRATLAVINDQLLPHQRAESSPVSHGPIRMEGAPPEAGDEALERIAGIQVGTPRKELLAAYGSCLVRQTWFRGHSGGAATELFHVAPDCRERLGSRTYTVARDAVTRIGTGNFDAVMTANPREDRLGDGPR